jgi:hypothetical protein
MKKNDLIDEFRIKREKIEIYNKKTSENIIKIDFVADLLKISNKNIDNKDLKIWLSLFCIYHFCKKYYKNEKILKHMKYYLEIILQVFDLSKVYFCLLFVYLDKPERVKKEILRFDFKGKDDFLKLFP